MELQQIITSAAAGQWYAYPNNRQFHNCPFLPPIQRLAYQSCEVAVAHVESQNISFVCIAGTNDAVDVIEDLAMFESMRSVDGIGVLALHGGMANHASNAVVALQDVQFLQRIVICGHSLGGAAAILMPLMSARFADAERIVTFGAPRCMKTASAAMYPHPERVIRFEKWLDFVPDVPLARSYFVGRWPISGWANVGRRIILGDAGEQVAPGFLVELWRRWLRLTQLAGIVEKAVEAKQLAKLGAMKDVINDWHSSRDYMKFAQNLANTSRGTFS